MKKLILLAVPRHYGIQRKFYVYLHKWRLVVIPFLLGLTLYSIHNFIIPYPHMASVPRPAASSKGVTDMGLCIMPKLTPGGKDIYDLDELQFASLFRAKPPCVNNNSTMFAIDFESNLIRLNPGAEFWNTANCFFQKFWRTAELRDYNFRKSLEITNVTLDNMKIPHEMEYIHLWCENASNVLVYEDYLSHVPVKPELEKLLEDRPASKTPENYPSILIIGQDSTSHMNFRRHMPKAHDYLVDTMKAVEFHGFNSLGAGTLWSVFPLLSGLDLNDINKVCHQHQSKRFDSCPWIWKDLEKLGYRTSYSEDAIHVGIFNGRPLTGFAKQPVHYDFRTMTNVLNRVSVGHNVRPKTNGCYGSRLTMDVLLENSVKLAYTFSKINKPFFHFSWTSELTHNVNYYSKFGEATMLKSLKQLHENQLLNNTVLILFSDHGMRYGELRQTTRQGFLEERLPILYVYLPEGLKKKYPAAYRNMKENTDKLTTAFDVYEMMKDLTNITELREGRLIERANEPGVDDRRNVSLFLPISPRRTCDLIGFSSIYCACMNRTSLPVNTTFAQETAGMLVDIINKNLSLHSICDQLKLVNIASFHQLQADVSLSDENARFPSISKKVKEVAGKMFEIGFETIPGKGMFYASVIQNRGDSTMKVTDINRVSAYGKDADCMQIKDLKPFCHCRQ